MRLPKALQTLIDQLERLPGIGPKTAQRLAFYLLHNPQHELDQFAAAFTNLKRGTKLCGVCKNVGETDPCYICDDLSRDHAIVCVVEQPLDVMVIERGGSYKGVYHVLHGAISPLNNIGPEQIYIQDLITRLRDGKIAEIIFATNPTFEGEATAAYIAKLIEAEVTKPDKLTRIGRGLPVGGDLEYADDVTLQRAIEGRQQL